MMADLQSEPLRNFLAQLVEQSSLRVAVVGAPVADRPNTAEMEMGASGGDVAQVHTSVVSPAAGDVVLVARQNPMNPAGSRLVFWLRNGTDPTLPAPLVGT